MDQPIQTTLDESTLSRIFEMLGSWGAVVPNQSENIRRLGTWRSLLQGIREEDRVRMAGSKALLQAAIQYVPTQEVPNRGRPLDWEGIDPQRSRKDQEKMALLLEEQQHWMEAGLIDGPTASSSEWPAVALLQALARSGQPLPHAQHFLTRAIVFRAPAILREVARLAHPQDLEEVLAQPIPGSPSNPPLLRSLLEMPDMAEEMARSGMLSKKALDIRTSKGGNAFFFSCPRADRARFWLQAGMRADVRNDAGMFAEEIRVGQGASMDELLLLHKELNAHRPAQQQALATWRLAATCIPYAKPSGENEPLLPQAFLQALAGPAPCDAHTPGDVVSFLEATPWHAAPPGMPEGALLEVMDHVRATQGKDGLDRWMAAQGGGGRVFGHAIALVAHPHADANKEISPRLLAQRAKAEGVTDEEIAMGILQSSLLASGALEIEKLRHATQVDALLGKAFSQPLLENTQEWLALAKKGQDNPLTDPLTPHFHSLMAALVVANVAQRIPRDVLLAEENLPVAWLLVASMPRIEPFLSPGERALSGDQFLGSLAKPLDVGALREIVEQALARPGMGAWWDGLKEEQRAYLKDSFPACAVQIEHARMHEALPAAPRKASSTLRF